MKQKNKSLALIALVLVVAALGAALVFLNGLEEEEDPGLPLIARRPPKQKFANFEEYLAAHGGVTAPVEGAEEAPALPEGEA